MNQELFERINSYIRIKILKVNEKNRKRLKNEDFSLISSNCNGGIILHDLGQKFNSPFVNLWISASDYLKILKDLKQYMDSELVFVEDPDVNYPVAMLKDAKIYFQHYADAETAERKWRERKARINWDNLYILFTDKSGCTYEQLKEFDALPYKNKAVLTCKKYRELSSAYYIKGFEQNGEVGILSLFNPRRPGYRYLDEFDYVAWLNK